MNGPIWIASILTILSLTGANTSAVSNSRIDRFLVSNGNVTTGQWSVWSEWSKCTSTCGSSERVRLRHCIGGHCTGDSRSYSICVELGCPGGSTDIDGNWGPWGSYSACTRTCGTGHRIRHRSCDSPAPSGSGAMCAGSSAMASICSHPSCTTNGTDGHWGQWSTYTTCSVTCGTGHRYRHRSCNNPAPSGSGHACVGSSSYAATCSYPACHPTAVNGHWGHWSSLSACSVTCGTGHRSRHRSCDSPAPSGSGHACVGSHTQSVTCSSGTTCTVNGGWAAWSKWSSCSKSCDLGTITRHRSCTHPVPSNGGLACTGNSQESHDCSNGPCPTWSHWFNGDCSVSCGDGTMERLRHCSTGREEECTGNAYEMVPCHNAICA